MPSAHALPRAPHASLQPAEIGDPRGRCEATFRTLAGQSHDGLTPRRLDVVQRRALLREKLQCARPPSMSPTCVRHDFLHEQWCRRHGRGGVWPELGRDPLHARWPQHSWADVVRDLLRNMTVFFAGDSIDVELFEFGRCALWRAGLATTASSVWQPSSFYNLPAVTKLGHMKDFLMLPTYRTALQLTQIGHSVPSKREPGNLSAIFDLADVIVVGYALHFSGVPWPQFEEKMVELWSQLNAFGARPGKFALYREVVTQHFPGTGHYDATEYARRYGKAAATRAQCYCEARPLQHKWATWWPCGRERCPTPRGMNELFHNLTRRFTNVHIVPIENLTRPRHRQHLGADKGPNCDCTHFCWTPEYADAYATNLYRALRQSGLAVRKVIEADGRDG